MTEREAKNIAIAHLASVMKGSGIEVAISDSATIETSYCWVFFYQSKQYLESGVDSDCLAGNAPIILAKADGRIHETGTARPLQHYLDQLAARAGWPST